MNFKEKLDVVLDTVENSDKYNFKLKQMKATYSNDEELFDALWTNAIRSQVSEQKQTPLPYARALYTLNIKCPLDLRDAIEQMVKEWDVSLEEIPWYLVNQFSRETITKLTNELIVKESDQKKQNILKTILYWVENMPTHISEKLTPGV